MRPLSTIVLALALGCAEPQPPVAAPDTSAVPQPEMPSATVPPLDACANDDGALSDASFVIVTGPVAGSRVQSPFEVTGCSRTFESNVTWRLVGRDGSLLADGYTMGGGVDSYLPFTFTVNYATSTRQIAHLEVVAPDPSGGEGPPPGRTILPLVLEPR